MSAINPNLELARLKHQWWWTDPEKRIIGGEDQRDVQAAKIWELLRRTKTYLLTFDTFNKVERQVQGNHLLFHARVRRQFGDPIGLLVACGGDPNLTWVDERLGQARGCLRRLSLPRQKSPAENVPMTVFLCELTRVKSKEQITDDDWQGYALKSIVPSVTKVLPPKSDSQIFVVIRFDVRLGEDALHEQLDREFKDRLRLLPETDLKHYAENSTTAGQIAYPALWKPTSLTDDLHHLADDTRLTASRDQPYALCWIPTCHNLKTVRERFHNQVRPENLESKVKAFQRIWQREKVTVQESPKPIYENKTVQVYPRPEDLPHDLTVRRAGEIKWEAICAFDHRVKKLNCLITAYLFDCYRRDSGKTALSNQEKDELLKDWRNGRGAVARRLQEIDAKLPPVGETFRLIWEDLFKHVPPNLRPKMPC